MMEYNFVGKRALVTGGSRGIGGDIVKALLNAGAEVYALARSPENLQKFKSDNPKVNTIAVDIADWDATRKAVEEVGDIDLLVNNAAALDKVLPLTPFVEMPKEKLDAAIDVNLKAAFNISQIVARGMIKRSQGGAIVNISSVAGLKASPGMSPYSISKAGMDMMTKCMALELGPHQIRVNTVSPTGVNTENHKKHLEQMKDNPEMMQRLKAMLDKHPLGKLTDMEDITNATLFLLSDRASMITGTILPVDAGFTIS